MKKVYLLKYESPLYFVLHDWVTYTLYLETVWFWGLFKTHSTIPYRIFKLGNFKDHFDHWDKLIKDNLPLK